MVKVVRSCLSRGLLALCSLFAGNLADPPTLSFSLLQYRFAINCNVVVLKAHERGVRVVIRNSSFNLPQLSFFAIFPSARALSLSHSLREI